MYSSRLRYGVARNFLFLFRNDLNSTSSGMLGVDTSLLAASALRFQICCAMGSKEQLGVKASPVEDNNDVIGNCGAAPKSVS